MCKVSMDKLEEMSAFFNRVAPNYDVVHVENIDGGIETKHMLAKYLPAGTKTLLDLGIGTGLELSEIFKRFPDVRVTGYDIAKDMLDRLVEKYPSKHLDLRNESYLAAHFGENTYDAALTVMTLHHYNHDDKTAIYRRICDSLRPGGIYVECDYMLSNQEYEDPQAVEDGFFNQYQSLFSKQRLDRAKEYHFDTPCTVDNQIKMLCAAGFSGAKVVWQYKNTVVVSAKKGVFLDIK